ncbi:MAG: N-6 DNA methylase, partial [Agathobacter sp.]|nr:N-6 DNA methylase [Agathobacter sp.]
MAIPAGFIKRAKDIMRMDDGTNGDAQYLEQLVWPLFLKVYDAKESDWEFNDENYKSIIPDECRWRNWAETDESGHSLTGDELLDFVNNTLFPKLKGLYVDNNTPIRQAIVKSTFEDVNNYMKSGTYLRQLLNLIDSIDFEDVRETHAFGDIYEELLRSLQSAGTAGEFYTPRAVTAFITQMINPKLGEKMADFACGTGGFITSWLTEIRKNITRASELQIANDSIYGIEKKPLPYLLGMTNMLLHDVDNPNIIRANSLYKNVLDYTDDEKFDVILMNPPYGGHEDSSVKNYFPDDLASSETADLFMSIIMYRLKRSGRAAVVLPDGFLTNVDSNSKVSIKKKLLDEFNLHTIVKLPNSTFAPYATVATNILFFDAGKKTDSIWFYKHTVPKGQKNYSKTKPIRIEEFDAEKEWWNNRVENEYAWKVSIDEIIANNYKIDFKNPIEIAEEDTFNPKDLLENAIETCSFIESLLGEISFESTAYAEDFPKVTIGEMCKVEKGKTAIKKSIPGEYPLVVTAEERSSSCEWQFDANAVCVPLVSSTGHGHASMKRIHYQSGKFALGNILCAIIPNNENELTSKYLYYYLSQHKDDILVPLMKGTTNVSLNMKDIKQVIIPLPPL